MKTNLAALELHYLLKELQGLVSAKIDKIYHPQKKELLLQLHIPNKGKKIFRILLPSCIYTTEYKPETEEPSGFCMFLRKHLGSARLRSIRQLGFERIVELGFEKKDSRLKLTIELFSKGNIILTDSNDKILSVLESQEWKDRTVKAKEKYIYPKKEFNFLELTETGLKELLSKSKRDSVVKALAMDLGLGGIYSEEALIISKIDKNKKPAQIKQIKKLHSALSKLKNKKITPQTVLKGGAVMDIVPFELDFYKEFEKKTSKTYNEALDKHFTKASISAAKRGESEKSRKKLEKQQNIIEQQKQKIKEMKSGEEKARQAGDIIYQNYADIKSVIEKAREIANKQGWEALKAHFKGNKLVNSVNSKDKTLTLNLP